MIDDFYFSPYTLLTLHVIFVFHYFQLQPNILLPITTIYVLMFLTGVLGNLAVCIVIIRNRSMHTATNYYLFSLAIADLLILILGKFELKMFPGILFAILTRN